MFDSAFEISQIGGQHAPNEVEVYPKIAMHQDVAHPDDLLPRNIRVVVLEVGRQRADGFSDDLKVVQNPHLDQFVVVKS